MNSKKLRSKLFLSIAVLTWVTNVSAAEPAMKLTPVIFQVLEPPLHSVQGSDGKYHLVYEIFLANLSQQAWRVEQVKTLSNGKVLSELSGTLLQSRMGSLKDRGGSTALGPEQNSVLWLHLVFPSKAAIPQKITHQLTLSGAPQPLVLSGAEVAVSSEPALAISSPLRGDNWVAADGCCDSVRHVRALLPINDALYASQRFAIDWEMLDADRRIYVGDSKNPESYFCYGKEVFAVADAEVVTAVDGFPNQVPGKLPEGIDINQADGNHVILKIAPKHYALYAHLKPGSVKVKTGDRVKAGQVLGHVGNSGNTQEPHLHFHVMDGPSALASSGLPYVLKSFELLGKARSTQEFDQAAAQGNPLVIESQSAVSQRQNELPLDLSLVRLP